MNALQRKLVRVFNQNFTNRELDDMYQHFTIETWNKILEETDTVGNDDEIPESFGTHQYHDIG